MLKPEHLRTLREVVRLGSFAAAANRLGYTSSAVSQQMASLERETGVRLFERFAHSVLPTSAAEVLARQSETLLADIERMVATVREVHRNSEPQVRLGVFLGKMQLRKTRFDDLHLLARDLRGFDLIGVESRV